MAKDNRQKEKSTVKAYIMVLMIVQIMTSFNKFVYLIWHGKCKYNRVQVVTSIIFV